MLSLPPLPLPVSLPKWTPINGIGKGVNGAWNTGHHWGGDFAQWRGSLLQKKGWDEVRNASAYYQQVKRAFDERGHRAGNPEEVRHLITRAYDYILKSETSCNFFWGSHWVHRSFDDLEHAYRLLDTAMSLLPS